MTIETVCVLGNVFLLGLLFALAIIVQRSDDGEEGCFSIVVGIVLFFTAVALFGRAGNPMRRPPLAKCLHSAGTIPA
jgi:Na+/phosphate symporter